MARLTAELAEAQLRRERLGFERDIGTHSDPAGLEVKILQVDATIAELEEALGTAPALAPATPAANDAAPLPEYLDTREAAALLGVSVKGLEGLRARGKGPKYTRVGSRIRYHLDDLRGHK